MQTTAVLFFSETDLPLHTATEKIYIHSEYTNFSRDFYVPPTLDLVNTFKQRC